VSENQVLFIGDKPDDLVTGKRTGEKVALIRGRARKEWGPGYLFPELVEPRSFLV